MDTIKRNMIERVKTSESITICCDADTDSEFRICFNKNKADVKKLAHDIALAIQDFYNKLS